MNQTLKVSAFLCLCFALTNANILDGLHAKKAEKKAEAITVVNENNARVKRQIPFGFGMDTSFMDYAAYDYYDWVCSGGTCQLCDVLTGACCVPNRNNNCFLPDSCANNPCLSGGTCITTRTVDGQPDFVCVCQRGLTGKYCQLIDEFTPPIMQPIPIPMGTAAVPVPAGGAAVPPPAGGAAGAPQPAGANPGAQPAGGVQAAGGAVAAGGAAPVQGSQAPNRMMGMSSFTNNVPASAQTQAQTQATGMMGGMGGMSNMMGGGMGGMGMGGMGGMGMGGMGGMPGMGGMGGMGNMMGGGMGGMGMGGMGMGGMGMGGAQGQGMMG